eukprot:1157523-Pelagomonas_calceolata.AAC.5
MHAPLEVFSANLSFTGRKADPTDSSPLDAAQAKRHCLLYFEALGSKEEAVFFHADQGIKVLPGACLHSTTYVSCNNLFPCAAKLQPELQPQASRGPAGRPALQYDCSLSLSLSLSLTLSLSSLTQCFVSKARKHELSKFIMDLFIPDILTRGRQLSAGLCFCAFFYGLGEQIIRGAYAVFLEVWMRYFPLGDQLLVIKSEDYFADQQQTLSKVRRSKAIRGCSSPVRHVLLCSGVHKSKHQCSCVDNSAVPLHVAEAACIHGCSTFMPKTVLRTINCRALEKCLATAAAEIKKAGEPQQKQPRPGMLPEARKILKDFYKPLLPLDLDWHYKYCRITCYSNGLRFKCHLLCPLFAGHTTKSCANCLGTISGCFTTKHETELLCSVGVWASLPLAA